jgi:hypothetical protein
MSQMLARSTAFFASLATAIPKARLLFYTKHHLIPPLAGEGLAKEDRLRGDQARLGHLRNRSH